MWSSSWSVAITVHLYYYSFLQPQPEPELPSIFPSEPTNTPIESPLRNDSFHLSMNENIPLDPNSETQLKVFKLPQDVSNVQLCAALLFVTIMYMFVVLLLICTCQIAHYYFCRVKQRAWNQDTTSATSRIWTPSTGGLLQRKEECSSSQLVSSYRHRQHLVSRQRRPQSLRLEPRDEDGNQLASCRKSVWLCVSMHPPTIATSKCVHIIYCACC